MTIPCEETRGNGVTGRTETIEDADGIIHHFTATRLVDPRAEDET